MNKVILEYLLKMYALLANAFPSLLFENVRNFIRSVLLKEFSDAVIDKNLIVFQDFYNKYKDSSIVPVNKPEFLNSILNDAQLLNNEISKKLKFIILLNLILFEKFLMKYTQTNQATIDFSGVLTNIAAKFQIESDEFNDLRNFISGTLYNISAIDNLLFVSSKKLIDIDIAFMKREGMPGQIFFFYLKSIKMIIFYYDGSEILTYNDKPLYSNHIYELKRGLFISGQNTEPVFYNQVLRFLISKKYIELTVDVNGIEYKFRRSNKGIHQLSLTIKSGELIGLIGRSGAGKSTLLNLLNGNLTPSKGSIQINSFDLNKNKNKLIGLIGYVPQDDLLIEELSVYRNLFLNAQLCFANLSFEQLSEKVNNLLIELNLFEVRKLKVGSPLNKYISGGQRKKLNIALELIREPWIIFADEPTSGLSSSDSEEIMEHLSELAISGRIVIVNIHQPSSDIFKLFDKILVIDDDGYSAYYGNPVDSIAYFHNYNNSQIAITDKCNVCGNLNTESIFRALEEKQVNEMGENSIERKTSPEKWHQYFTQSFLPESSYFNTQLPEYLLIKPNALKQYLIFFNRNLLSKLSNRTYTFLALAISPFLAVILAFLCKSGIDSITKQYIFGLNENITAFLFMSVLVSLFVGLIISAEEIIRDRRILVRESFLNLSKSSYIFSKVSFLFGLSAVQTLLFVIISNHILEIHGMLGRFWIILFSASCFANLLGLFISSIFKSVVVIYILVPLLIVPQILLSGVVVNYEKLNEKVSNRKFVPFVGDLMVSRWAYEALLVSQFRYNEFQSYFYQAEKKMSNAQFDYLFIIPEVKNEIGNLKIQQAVQSSDNKFKFIHNELLELYKNTPQISMPFLPDKLIELSALPEIDNYLDKLKTQLWNENKMLNQKKDSIIHSLIYICGSKTKFLDFKKIYYNENLSEFMLKRQSFEPFQKTQDEIIRQLEPVYQNPTSNYGRAQFLSSEKRIGRILINTPLFNVLAIWAMSIVVFAVLLLYSVLHYHKK
jgi:ABC-type multidrug transport system ATPase subunit